MADIISTKIEFDNNAANAFVEEFCKQNETETSMIVAGMMAVINGNDEILEKMKNQKWFERIWFTITGKNKASVQEMQRNRDVLNKYLVQMIVKITNMVEAHSVQAVQLSSVILRLDGQLREMKIDIDKIAMALNDKIIDLKNYDFIKDDIRNGKYPTDKPLLSLIDIISQLDSITLNDPKRLQQLKETMENSGFSFDSKVDVREYAEQVLELPKEKAGRILLFCQNFSKSSRFLAFTSSLLESCLYLGETDLSVVRESGEAVQNALSRSRLSEGAGCIVENMYNDLKKVVPDRYAELSSLAKKYKVEQSNKIQRRINGVVVGREDSEKNTLLSSILKHESMGIATSTVGSAIFDRYFSVNNMLTLYDTPGLELGDMSNNIQNIKALVKEKAINTLLYCVSFKSTRFFPAEAELISELRKEKRNLAVYIILTECSDPDDDDEQKMIRYIREQTNNAKVISVYTKKYINVSPYGIQELIDEVAYE